MEIDIDYSRLWNAIAWSRKKLEPFRTVRKRFIEEYVGANYNIENNLKENPVNLLLMAVDIHHALLTAAEPLPDVTTLIHDYIPEAESLELALEQLAGRIKLSDTIEAFVFDAIFMIGITKTGSQFIETRDIDGVDFNITKPYVKVVDFDNWVHDFNANSLDECQFYGDKYRIPLEKVKNNPRFDPNVVKRLKPTPKISTTESGDEKIGTLETGGEYENDEFVDFVELWDLYLPSKKIIVTLPEESSFSEEEGRKPLEIIQYDGHGEGPYDFLYFNKVPGNSMPLPPVAAWLGLHEVENMLYRKMNKQAERQKKVAVYQKGGSEDADNFRTAEDGSYIGVDGPANVNEISSGGVDQTSFAFAIHINNVFKILANNLDTLGGLGAMAGTVGQEQILDRNSSRKTKKMIKKTDRSCSSIYQKLAQIIYSDPVLEIKIQKSIPGAEDIKIPSTFSAQNRMADFFDFDISIKSFSMQRMSPEERMDAILRILMEVIIPLLPALQEQGGQIDFNMLFNALSRNSHLPEIKNILTFAESQLEQSPSGQRPMQSPTTTRRYVRSNQSEQTTQGADHNLMNALMGGNGVSPNRLANSSQFIGTQS